MPNADGTLTPSEQLAEDTRKAAAQRDQFAAASTAAASQYAAPTQAGVTIAAGPQAAARNLQTAGLGTVDTGVGLQKTGAVVQQAGLGTQAEGVGIQKSGLGALGEGRGALNEGLGTTRQGLSTQMLAAKSYQDALSGNQPSVAALTAQRLQGQNVASMYGGAAGATGGNRALALRSAINGAGAAGSRAASDAGIARAAEMDSARQGLLAAGNSITGTGSAQGSLGTGLGGIGQGVAGVGQGVTAGGQGISATGAGVANTGSGIVNSGVAQSGIGTAVRTGDIDIAGKQAGLDAATQKDNAGNVLDANKTNAGLEVGLAGASNQAGSTAVQGSASKTTADLNQAQFDKEHQTVWADIGDKLGISSEAVKSDIKPAPQDLISNLFLGMSSLTGGGSGAPPITTPGASLIAAKPLRQNNIDGDIDKGVKMAQTGAQLYAMSDEGVKNKIVLGTPEARNMFAAIAPKTWRYDRAKLDDAGLPEPQTEGRTHLGVIAQDVEKAGPVGEGMVEEVHGVKAINIPMAVSALMAAMADVEKRLGTKRKAA